MTGLRITCAAMVALLLAGGCAPGEEAGPASDPPDEGLGVVDAGDPASDPDGLGEGGGYVPDTARVEP